MLSIESLNAIKQQSESANQKSKTIYIEIGSGFAYGSVTIGSASDKETIRGLADQLEWIYKEGATENKNMMYRTNSKFEDGKHAIAVGNVIENDLKGKGYQVKSEVKTYR